MREQIPLPKMPQELLRPTRVRAIRSFWVSGQDVEVGRTIDVPRHVADDLIGANKAELVR